MKTQIVKWGNSLAIRLPKPVADAAKLRKGDRVSLRVTRSGAVELSTIKPKPTLAQLVRGITLRNCHGETDWGPARGNEAW